MHLILLDDQAIRGFPQQHQQDWHLRHRTREHQRPSCVPIRTSPDERESRPKSQRKTRYCHPMSWYQF